VSRSPLGPQIHDPQQAYLDAWQELAVRIQQGQSFSGRERNCCFLNTRGPRFADVSSAVGLDQIDDCRALALVDWDHDGDLDVWETNRTGPRVRFLRNDLPVDNHFLTLQLVGDPGQGCPYDAIGARVTLELRAPDGQAVRQIRTLTAGDGFLSQSSKTIHFGFGPDEQIERLTVLWPGVAAAQVWTGLSPNQRYRLVLGKTDAQRVAARSTVVALRPDTQVDAEPPRETTARLWFSAPPSFTPQPYRPFTGQAARQVEPDNQHLLVVFWASWCQPCLTELQELNERYPALQEGGLEILALSVEGLDSQPEADIDAAPDLAARSNWKFHSGWASQELIEHLDTLRHDAIYRQDRLPIPVSFLIDRERRLRAVYAGPVDPEQLEEDVRALDVDDDPLNLARSVPFAGRWCDELFVTHPVAIASIYREERQFDDAREYLRRHLAAEPAPPADDASPEATAARRRLADIYQLLGQISVDTQQESVAIQEFQTALELNPRHFDALLGLGDLWLAADRLDDARRRLAAADAINPRDPRPANQLGLLALKQDRPAEAIREFERSLANSPSYFPAANNLAWLLATHRQASVRNGSRAVKLAEEIIARVGARPDLLDTLAAAYAEAGDFVRAVESAELAVRSAQRARLTQLAAEISARLATYRAGRPFHSSPAVLRPE
jgi:tetratricopeptide (TPR) repeat protein